MPVVRSILLFMVAALAEIGGAWLVWQGVREHKGLACIGGGVIALGIYGFVATFQPDPHFGRFQPDPHFGRILAAYCGVFVAGSLAWGMVFDKFTTVAPAVVAVLAEARAALAKIKAAGV
jgi:small multidrug resistance family-3 protein